MELKKTRIPESFYSLYAVARMMGIPKSTVDCFDKEHPPIELTPIVRLFICFEEEGRRTWAIRKKYFDKWRQTGKVPKVSPGRPPKWKNDPTYDNLNIPIKKDLYNKLKKVVDNANATSVIKLTYRDAIYLAIEEFTQRRPQFLDGDK